MSITKSFQDELLLKLLEFALSPKLGDLSELQLNNLTSMIESLTIDPNISDYIFWPNHHNLDDSPTAEAIFLKSKSYQPIQL